MATEKRVTKSILVLPITNTRIDEMAEMWDQSQGKAIDIAIEFARKHAIRVKPLREARGECGPKIKRGPYDRRTGK